MNPGVKSLAKGSSMALILTGAILILGASTARAATFPNPSPITIPAGPGNAAPYPSSIVVSGLTGTVTDVNISLFDFSHTRPDDVGVLLVAPSGQAFKAMDGAGDDTDATNINLTLDDAAASALPTTGALASGTFRPTSQYSTFNFPAPGPGTAYSIPAPIGSATFASVFNGVSPNGTWNLFVRDFTMGESGQFLGGWSLEVSTPPPAQPLVPPTQTTPTKKKCKKKGKKRSASAAKRCKKKKRK
jgi:subtilisin-like proprotein convertase family protein